MAASDPVPSVPTPTGALQGCAAYSWDGAAWQPSTAAYSSVATPTGVLRGVAPFSWSGSAWTPTGKAMPGVPTPTGTLDGVAVYTWSGSAWTPAGGAPDVPTPTGTLQGVAAFYWDGSAWQPAGQAMPEVATPTGVLQGVAMFQWNGAAWGAAPTLDLNFLASPGTLDPRITFTRGSTATYFDATGTMQTVSGNTPRWDYDPATHVLRGLLIEEGRTNTWLVSADLSDGNTTKTGVGAAAPTVTANQSIAPDGTLTAARMAMPAVGAAQVSVCAQAVAATANQWSFSAWLKGNAGGEVVYLMATPDGVTYYRTACTLTTTWQRFTLTTSALTATTWYFQIGCDRRDASQTNAGALTCFAWGMQKEQGAFPTSYIPTTGASVTRSADVATMPIAAWYNAVAGSFSTTFIYAGQQTGAFDAAVALIGANGNTDYIEIYVQQSNLSVTGNARTAGTSLGFSNSSGSLTAGTPTKAAFAFSAGTGAGALNGVLNGAAAFSGALPTIVSLVFMQPNVNSQGQMSGWLQRVRYWPRVLSNTELQQVTT